MNGSASRPASSSRRRRWAIPADMPPSGAPDGTQPSARVGGAAQRDVGRAADPHGQVRLHGPGGDAHLLVGPGVAGVRRELVVEHRPHRVERLVQQGVAPGGVDAERGELAVDGSAADPEDGPTAGQGVERRPLLGRRQRVAQRQGVAPPDEPDPMRDGRQVGQGGHAVPPHRGQLVGPLLGHGDVVAHRDVGEAGVLGDAGDGRDLVDAGAGLPRLGVPGRLGLDGQPEAERHRSWTVDVPQRDPLLAGQPGRTRP